MKLAFVTASYEEWGAERSLRTIIGELSLRGNQTCVIADQTSPIVELSDHRYGEVRAHRYARSSPNITHSDIFGRIARCVTHVGGIVKSGIRLRQHVRDVDVVVSFSVWQTAEAVIAGLLTRTPVVLDLHETFNSRFARCLLPVVARCVKLVIAPTDAVLANTLGATGVVIPRPVDISNLQSISDSKIELRDQITIGVFGQIAPHKQVAEVTQKILDISNSGIPIKLLVVGGKAPAERSAYESGVWNVADSHPGEIEIHERVDDIWELMHRCDVVVNMSVHEAFGRTVVEACYSGAIPVVADNGGPPEIVRTTGIGVICSIDKISEGIQSALIQRKMEVGKTLASRIEALNCLYGTAAVVELYESALKPFIRTQD